MYIAQSMAEDSPAHLLFRRMPQPIAHELIETLERLLVERSIADGFALLEKIPCEACGLNYKDPLAISLLLSIAQWTDLGYRDLAFFDTLTGQLGEVNRMTLPMVDFLKLRMAEGY